MSSSITFDVSMERLLYLLIEFPNISEKRLDTVAFVFINDLTCPLSNRFNNSTATFFCFNPSTSFKKSSDRIDKSGCLRPSV